MFFFGFGPLPTDIGREGWGGGKGGRRHIESVDLLREYREAPALTNIIMSLDKYDINYKSL
jgi:hypothetical protein